MDINITKSNKEEKFEFISSLLDAGYNGTLILNFEDNLKVSDTSKISKTGKTRGKIDYLSIPNEREDLMDGVPIINKNNLGSWGQFNSFFPGKAVIRILAHMLEENETNKITLDKLINKAKEIFMIEKLISFRGFPKNPDKDTSIGRLVWHFVYTFYEMGLIKLESDDVEDKIFTNELWVEINVSLTKQGLEFARLRNNIFDDKAKNQVLTEEERAWMINYLKNLDQEGYKEYTLLSEVYDFLREGHNGKNELWNWLKRNENFIKYVKGWSRKHKRGDIEKFKEQLNNLSVTFGGSKIALLRELGVVENKRNRYGIIGGLK